MGLNTAEDPLPPDVIGGAIEIAGSCLLRDTHRPEDRIPPADRVP